MSVLLQYEFTTGSLAAVKRAFKTVEGYSEQSARNEERTRSRVSARARPASAKAAIDPQKKALDDLQKFGATRMRQELKERETLEKRGHADRLRMIDRERREGIAAEKARDSVRRATVGAAASTAFRSTVGIGKAILGATGLAGGAIVASRIGPGIDLEHQQRQVLRAGRLAGTEYAMSQKDFAGKVTAASIKTGASQEDVTAGAAAFVQKTGDIKGATDNLETFATVAMATGATVEDIGSAAADLSQKFDIKTTEGMADALAMLAFQGKKGAFEIKNMAAEFPVLASAAANAGMRGTGGVKQLGGLIQIATVGAGKEQATTALIDAFSELTKHAHDLEIGKDIPGKRISVFEKGKGIGHGEVQRNFGDVISEVIGGAHGDLTKIEPIFGLRGKKAIAPLISAYQHADLAAGGGKAGDTAGRAAIASMIKENVEAGGTFKEVQIDAAHAMQDTSVQLEILNTKLSAAVSSSSLPAMQRLLPLLVQLIPSFEKLLRFVDGLVESLANNPLEQIGHIIAGKIALDIAAAAIGPTIREALVNAISGSGAEGGGGKGGGLGGGMGTLGNVLSGITIATLAVETFRAGSLLIDNFMPTNKADVEKDITNFNTENTAVRSGDVGALTSLRGDLQGQLSGSFESKDPLLRLAQMLGSTPDAGPGGGKAGQALAAEKLAHDALLKASIDRLTAEIGKINPAAPGKDPDRSGDPTKPRVAS